MPKLKSILGLVWPALACTAAQADNCEQFRWQIEAKIRASGGASATVVVAALAASTPGRVVGSCGKGTRKLVYTQGGPVAAGSPAAMRHRDDNVLTECKDGSVSVGGDCTRKPRP